MYAYTHYGPNLPGVASNTDEAAVRQVVTEFGTKLQAVPLLAPAETRKAAMEENYGPYVAPELLDRWAAGSSEALGRSVSSPWPERIDIVEVRQEGDTYVVEGNVREIANTEGGGTVVVAVYPVTLTLQKMQDGEWRIVQAAKGAYSEIPRPQAIIGTWECLPHKDQTGPQTMECALGVAVDTATHYGVSTELMATYPVDFPTGAKVRVAGTVTPVEQLSALQKYDITGVIHATAIERI